MTINRRAVVEEVAAAAVDVQTYNAASSSAGGVAVTSAIFTLVKDATAVEVAVVETVA